MTIPSEHMEQTALVQWLKIKKIDYFAVPNAQALSSQNKMMAIRVMQKLKAEGLVDGTSDIVVLTKNKILFIEMKRRPKKLKNGNYTTSHTKLSPAQEKFLDMVEKYDYAVSTVCYGFDETKEFIERYTN